MSTEVDDVKKKLRRWFEMEGFEVNEQATKRAYFKFFVSRTAKHSFIVAQPTSRIDSIEIVHMILLGATEKKRLAELEDKEIRDLVRDLRMNVALTGTGCHLGFLPSEVGSLSSKTDAIVILKTIYYDGLSKDRLFEAIDQAAEVYHLVGWFFGKIGVFR